ncbi:MAG TPA: NFACT RNA binding domain-containing protein [Desulfuromonadales bacterium]|nr:NFACT RNA binding domain-containing protein [Desulfuromonadales bacterium]
MDVFFLEAIVAELRAELAGARIDKIHQPSAETVVMRLWTGRCERYLLLSAAPRLARIHFTEARYPNPAAPPRFCQLLRARLARIHSVAQEPGERIVTFDCAGRDGHGYRLVAEMFGRHANLLLLDERGTIIDTLRRPEGTTGGRELLPGALYRLPMPAAAHRLDDPLPEVPAGCKQAEAFRRWLLATLRPMSPLIARDLAARVTLGTWAEEALADFVDLWRRKTFSPAISSIEGTRQLTAFPLAALKVESEERFTSSSVAADRFYAEAAVDEGGIGGRGELLSVVRKALRRLESRRTHIDAEQQRRSDFEAERRRGELLLANLHHLRRGLTEVTLDDYYCDPPQPVTIPLDPALSPHENAERRFKMFRKGKRAGEHLARRLAETRVEEEWLAGIGLALEEAGSAVELAEVRRELEEGGLLPAPSERRRPAKTAEPEAAVRKDKTPGGYPIAWGKNNRSNDYVSRRLTAADDWWFHAHELPGCHLVLKTSGKPSSVPETDLLYAAAVAAGYSRGKQSEKVEVIIAPGAAVRKPRGARPGLVVVERFRTVVVRPLRPQ